MSSIIDGTVEGENTCTITFMDKQLYDALIYEGCNTIATRNIVL